MRKAKVVIPWRQEEKEPELEGYVKSQKLISEHATQ